MYVPYVFSSHLPYTTQDSMSVYIYSLYNNYTVGMHIGRGQTNTGASLRVYNTNKEENTYSRRYLVQTSHYRPRNGNARLRLRRAMDSEAVAAVPSPASRPAAAVLEAAAGGCREFCRVDCEKLGGGGGRQFVSERNTRRWDLAGLLFCVYLKCTTNEEVWGVVGCCCRVFPLPNISTMPSCMVACTLLSHTYRQSYCANAGRARRQAGRQDNCLAKHAT